MITTDDILTFRFTTHECEFVWHHSRECSLGGSSNVRGGEARQQSLSEDQTFGQFCELAGWMTFYGREDGLFLYNASREIRNADPWASDGGNDIEIEGVETPIDMKGSRMRYGPDPLDYNLVYPLREHNNETLYLLGLAHDQPYTAHVVGFIVGHEMPNPRDFKGFGKRRWISARKLHPLSELL